jgi:hypothetical protein
MKDIMTLRWVRWIMGALVAAVIFFLAFGLGVSVGYQKAIFASEWGKNYELNFSGPPQRGLVPIAMPAVGNMHGVAGTVIDVSSGTVAVKDNDNDEQSIAVASDTVIRKMDETISLDALMAGDRVVVIGMPNAEGQVEAHFIRVFPAPGPGSGNPEPPQP